MVTIIKPETPGKLQWTADRRIYLDKDGNAVEAKDPARVSLLIAAGCTMPMELARKYGLARDAEPETAPTPLATKPAVDDVDSSPLLTVTSEPAEVVNPVIEKAKPVSKPRKATKFVKK